MVVGWRLPAAAANRPLQPIDDNLGHNSKVCLGRQTRGVCAEIRSNIKSFGERDAVLHRALVVEASMLLRLDVVKGVDRILALSKVPLS